MLQKFLQFIDNTQLFKPENKILLAVSGGIDSVAMADLFYKAKFNFGIAHCNFGLRGEASDADELFVQKMAKKYKVSCHVNHFDTQGYAEKEKISTQMAARYLRYQWFNTLLTEGFQYIATAHHQNDVLETLLLNLTRGTGIAGFHGIKAKSGKVIRPVLFADKEMIMEYIAENQLSWREDSSNESVKYQRNLIRHEVIPKLQQINPDLVRTIQNTVERVEAVENIFREQVQKLQTAILDYHGEDTYVAIADLLRKSEPALYLSEILKEYHFNYIQAKNIIARLQEGAGKIFESPTHKVNIDRDQLVICPRSFTAFQDVLISKEQKTYGDDRLSLQFSTEDKLEFKISREKNIAALDYDQLKFPLKLRKWKEGDWFCPLGMNKKKKLSDFMIDEKIPLNLKERVLVITSGKAICWVVDHRIDDRFKITDKTRKIYTITRLAGNDQSI